MTKIELGMVGQKVSDETGSVIGVVTKHEWFVENETITTEIRLNDFGQKFLEKRREEIEAAKK